jgi:hypothetical protein
MRVDTAAAALGRRLLTVLHEAPTARRHPDDPHSRRCHRRLNQRASERTAAVASSRTNAPRPSPTQPPPTRDPRLATKPNTLHFGRLTVIATTLLTHTHTHTHTHARNARVLRRGGATRRGVRLASRHQRQGAARRATHPAPATHQRHTPPCVSLAPCSTACRAHDDTPQDRKLETNKRGLQAPVAAAGAAAITRGSPADTDLLRQRQQATQLSRCCPASQQQLGVAAAPALLLLLTSRPPRPSSRPRAAARCPAST